MKLVQGKTGTLSFLENGQKKEKEVSYYDLMLDCLDQMPEKGFDLKELRARRRVSDQIESFQKNEISDISLEEADYDKLKQCVQQMRWGLRSKFVEGFIEIFS